MTNPATPTPDVDTVSVSLTRAELLALYAAVRDAMQRVYLPAAGHCAELKLTRLAADQRQSAETADALLTKLSTFVFTW